jgi:hypothetical protein
MLSIKFHVNQTLFALVTGYYLLQGMRGNTAADWRHKMTMTPISACGGACLGHLLCSAPSFPSTALTRKAFLPIFAGSTLVQLSSTAPHPSPLSDCERVTIPLALTVSYTVPCALYHSLPPRTLCVPLSTSLN